MNQYEETPISRVYQRYDVRCPQPIALQQTTENAASDLAGRVSGRQGGFLTRL